jgi:hypothetical protein
MKRTMPKTIHVYPADGVWAIKKVGERLESFTSKKKAVGAAVSNGKKRNSAQIVVHRKGGEIEEIRTFGMPKVQNPPKKSRNAAKIERAVKKVSFDRIQASSPREQSAKK